MIERMFEELSDAGLVEGMAGTGRMESAGTARRLALVGELYARRAQEWAER